MDAEHQTVYWRDYIPSPDTPRSKELAASDAYQWSAARCREPFIAGWKETWELLQREPYKGVTTEGQVVEGLFHLHDDAEGRHSTTSFMTAAARKIVVLATPEQQSALLKAIDAPEWRRWMNPEIYVYRHGVRLEEASEELVTAIHDLMRASLSREGYIKASGCMQVNGFLGEVVNGRKVLNERSYNFTIFGTPSENEPWGWQLHGHHLDINCFVVRNQMVVSPVFMGAEPNVIDSGPNKGIELFTDQEQTALELVGSMDQVTRDRVQVYKDLSGPEYPDWRYHRADQRHLGGAFQDNRVIPYEGLKVTALTKAQQDLVKKIINLSINYLPASALTAKLEEIGTHWEETYFCWIGGFQGQAGFYYKVHSPVVLLEFDHHSGVFLSNKDPLPFHIHTLVRTPNGNDYGKDLLRKYRLKHGE